MGVELVKLKKKSTGSASRSGFTTISRTSVQSGRSGRSVDTIATLAEAEWRQRAGKEREKKELTDAFHHWVDGH